MTRVERLNPGREIEGVQSKAIGEVRAGTRADADIAVARHRGIARSGSAFEAPDGDALVAAAAAPVANRPVVIAAGGETGHADGVQAQIAANGSVWKREERIGSDLVRAERGGAVQIGQDVVHGLAGNGEHEVGIDGAESAGGKKRQGPVGDGRIVAAADGLELAGLKRLHAEGNQGDVQLLETPYGRGADVGGAGLDANVTREAESLADAGEH